MNIITSRDDHGGIRVTIEGITLDTDGKSREYSGPDTVTFDTSYMSARNAVLAVFADLFGNGVQYPDTGHTVTRVTPLSQKIKALEAQLATLKREAANC